MAAYESTIAQIVKTRYALLLGYLKTSSARPARFGENHFKLGAVDRG
jgi:hypothetical protein